MQANIDETRKKAGKVEDEYKALIIKLKHERDSSGMKMQESESISLLQKLRTKENTLQPDFGRSAIGNKTQYGVNDGRLKWQKGKTSVELFSDSSTMDSRLQYEMTEARKKWGRDKISLEQQVLTSKLELEKANDAVTEAKQGNNRLREEINELQKKFQVQGIELHSLQQEKTQLETRSVQHEHLFQVFQINDRSLQPDKI